MKLKYLFLFSFFLPVMWMLVSCKQENESILETLPVVTATNTVRPSTLEPTITSSALSTTILTDEITPKPTSDLITPTISDAEMKTYFPVETTSPSIIVETLTPLPTFTSNELNIAVIELLGDPMNCNVPCWWWGVPNESTVFEIQQTLALYQFKNYYTRDDDGNKIPDYIEVWFNEEGFDFRVMYSFQNNILQTVFSEQAPSLFEILNKYGRPDEVWLSTMSSKREGDLPVRLNLVYLQEGMAIGYVVEGDIQDDSVIVGCFSDDEAGILRLISPNSKISYTDFHKIFFPNFIYFPLEEATDFTIEEFIKQFSDSSQPQCIDTPRELWE